MRDWDKITFPDPETMLLGVPLCKHVRAYLHTGLKNRASYTIKVITIRWTFRFLHGLVAVKNDYKLFINDQVIYKWSPLFDHYLESSLAMRRRNWISYWWQLPKWFNWAAPLTITMQPTLRSPRLYPGVFVCKSTHNLWMHINVYLGLSIFSILLT